ncbi:hypothetical protein D3C71_314770 [compost metagenome]
MDAQTQVTHSEAPTRPAGVPAVAQEVNGQFFMEDSKGKLTPLKTIKAAHLLEDETVRRIMDFAVPLNEQIQRFKQHTLDDVASLLSVFDQDAGVKSKGGRKGNVTLNSFDGRLKVQLAIADQIDFGPQLQSAKLLVDECLVEWSSDSRPELQAIVHRAFNTEKEGLVNRAELFSLLRLEIEDERWQRAMTAIKDSIRVTGKKEYVRFYRRKDHQSDWQPITIDVAVA